MASASENTIDIIFRAVDEFTQTLDGISGKIEGFGKGLQDIADPFADMAKGVLAIEAAFLAVGAAVLKTRADISNETSKMAASFDIPLEKAKELEPAFKKLYAEGFADSITEGAETVKLAFQKFGDIGTDGIENISEKALALKSVFGVEVAASIASAKTLVTNFGISGDEAMDLITAGFQKGLDGSGDFLESINEYSTQFANGGATADQFFSVMQSGYQEGVLGTDKAADAFKEFRVRIQDGSKTTSDALKAIGIDADDLGKRMSGGTITAAQAFDIVIKKLNETKDSNTVMQAGVGLLGTQFEDLGTKAALNLSTTTSKMKDFIGKSDELAKKMEQLSPFEKLWKSFTSGVTDLPMFDKFYAEAEETVKKIREIMPDAFGLIDTSELENALGKLQDAVKNIFGDVDLSTPEGLAAAFQMVVDSGKSLTETTTGIIEVFKPLFAVFLQGVEYYNNLSTANKELIGNILGIAIPVSTAAGALGTFSALIGGIGTMFTTGAGGIAAFGAALVSAGAAVSAFAIPLAAIATIPTGIMYFTSDTAKKKIDEVAQGFLGWADSLIDWTGTHNEAGESSDEVTKKLIAEAKAMQDARKATEENMAAIDKALADAFNFDDVEIKPVKIGLDVTEFQKQLDDGITEFYVTTKDDIEKNHVKIQAAFDPNEDAEKAEEYISYIQNKISDLQVKLNTESAQKDFVDLQNYVKDLDYDIKALRAEESFLKIRLLEETDIEKGADIEKRLKEISEGLTLLDAESADLTVTLNESEYAKTKKEIDSLVTERHLTVLADEDSVAHAKGYIAEKIGDHTVITNIFPPSPENVKKTKEELEKIVPPEKQLQIMAEIDIANIEAQTEKFKSIQETIQSKFEWQAKLDIAEVESNTAILEKSMDNINTMFTESSSLISDAFGLLGSLDFGTAGAIDIYRLVKDQIREQNDLQREALGLQKEITQSQIKLNEAKQKALLMGKPMFEITVDGSGLQTHLESILYSIMQFAQEKATMEGLESLLGA